MPESLRTDSAAESLGTPIGIRPATGEIIYLDPLKLKGPSALEIAEDIVSGYERIRAFWGPEADWTGVEVPENVQNAQEYIENFYPHRRHKSTGIVKLLIKEQN